MDTDSRPKGNNFLAPPSFEQGLIACGASYPWLSVSIRVTNNLGFTHKPLSKSLR
jgi:hypothetical protein